MYSQIEVALGHEPPARRAPRLPARRDRPEDSSQIHAPGTPQDDRKDDRSPTESRRRGFVGSSPSPPASECQPSAPPTPGPALGPRLPAGPCDVRPGNLSTPNPKFGGADRGSESFLHGLHARLSAADSHSPKAGSAVPATSPQGPHPSRRLRRPSQEARAAPEPPHCSLSPQPALPPVEGPQLPKGTTLPAWPSGQGRQTTPAPKGGTDRPLSCLSLVSQSSAPPSGNENSSGAWNGALW